jgi:hypothetical protein
MGLRGNAYTLLVERYERRTVKRSRCRWKENIKIDRRKCTGFFYVRIVACGGLFCTRQ